MEKSGRQQLNQVIKLLLSTIKQNLVPPTHNITIVMLPSQMADLNQVMRNMRHLQADNHFTKQVL